MEVAIAILSLLLKEVPELVQVIKDWIEGTGDETDPIYAKVSKELDDAMAALDAKLKK